MIGQFDIVKDLVSKCKREEIKSFRSFLTAFDSGTGKHRGKSLKLLNYLVAKRNYHEHDVCLKIYGAFDKRSQQAFNRLLNRFKSKLYECLCLDINVYRDDSLSEL